MKIVSSAFTDGGVIPSKYSCKGENISPQLSILDIPADTQSMVLIMDDPDAPGGTFTHWVVWAIPPNTTAFAEGRVPEEAVEATNDFAKIGYGGPCPPSGTHHYVFRLYALNQQLVLPSNASRAQIENAMRGKVIQTAQLTGTFSA